MTGAAGTATESATAPRPRDEWPVMRSPAGRLHAARGASFRAESGWEIPASYGDTEAERTALREAVAICDVTARGKVDIHGRVDEALPDGVQDGIVARISHDWALVFTAPGEPSALVRELEGAAGDAAMVTDVTHLYSGYALAGPRLDDLVARLTSYDHSTLAPGAAAGAPIAEVRAVLVRRELEVPVVEAYVASEFGRYVWESLLEVAERLGGAPVGWDALRAEGWS